MASFTWKFGRRSLREVKDAAIPEFLSPEQQRTVAFVIRGNYLVGLILAGDIHLRLMSLSRIAETVAPDSAREARAEKPIEKTGS